MGKFIGGAGAAFIMCAAAAVIVKFLMEINVFKDKNSVKLYGKVSVIAIAIGLAYVFMAVFMYNEVKEQTNFFEFDKVFAFLDIDSVTEQYKNPVFSQMFGGLLMPLYPCLVHIIGRIVLEQYVLTAEFISFTAACVSACLAYSILKTRLEKEKATDIMLIAVSLPYAFMIFTPTYVSLTLMLMLCGVYALSKNNYTCFVIMVILSCLASKLGLLLLIYLSLQKSGIISKTMKKLDKSVLLNNEVVKKIVLSLLILFNDAVMFCLIRGI